MSNFIDKAIEYIAPSWAAERAAARLQIKGLGNAYDNVPTWRNSGNWQTIDAETGESANSMNRDEARRKARHLERNSEVVNALISAYERNVVGAGFNLQVRSKDQKWNNEIEALWKEWCRPGNCEVTGTYSLNEVLKAVVRRRFVDGGILLLKTIDKGAKIPFKLQIVEVDSFYSLVDKENVVGGIEIDDYNKPVGYYIKKIPLSQTAPEEDYYRVPADRVYFLAYHQRPSEVREMTPLARTLMEIRDLDEFQDAVAFKEKINAAVAVWVTSDKDTMGVYGQGTAAGNGNGGGMINSRIKPGSITELPPGKKVQTLVPPGQASEYSAYNVAALRRISAGHGLSYELVTRDVSQVNYSSARQNLLEDWKVIKMEQQYLIQHLLDFIFEEVVQSAVLAGAIKAPKQYFQDTGKYLKHEFIGQGMPWIDPYKEAIANKTLLESALTTLKDIYAKDGIDWEEEINQMAIERKALIKAGMIKEQNNNEQKT